MLENLNLKQKIIFFIILSIMIIFIIYYIYSTLTKTDTTFISSLNNDLDNNNSIVENNLLDSQATSNIIVYVCGCVKETKNVTLKEGSRISDAIDAAGGLTENADLTNINLAYILEDGEKIYIPKKGETIIDSNNTNSNSTSFSTSFSTKDSKININKATQTELELISGIGPSTALKIINYRKENGNFKKIEDIKNVPGIGDTKFNQIKDYITIK